MRTLASQFDANSVWPWVTGAFVLLIGLIVVALHPYLMADSEQRPAI